MSAINNSAMLGEFSDEKDLKIAELLLKLEKMSVEWAGEVEITNNRWIADNEHNEVIIDALKEEVEKLQEENKLLIGELNKYDPWEDTKDIVSEFEKLKDCNYEEYSSIVGENKLIKEFEDLKNECGELKKEAEVREDWIHNVMRCLEVYEEWEGAGGDETADDLADRVARENKDLKEKKKYAEKCCQENFFWAVGLEREIKDLKHECGETWASRWASLKEENKKLQEELELRDCGSEEEAKARGLNPSNYKESSSDS